MATTLVYEFLKDENRPYNLNDIVSKLPNAKGKPAIQQALDKLVRENKIFEKTYGKQKIFCIVQETKHDASELMRIASEYQIYENELEKKCLNLETDLKSRELTLAGLKNCLTMEEALKEKSERIQRIRDMEKKLDFLMERSSKEDLKESQKEAQKKLDVYTREYTRRKRLCTEVIDSILEGFPGTKKQLYDDIGIEAKIVK